MIIILYCSELLVEVIKQWGDICQTQKYLSKAKTFKTKINLQIIHTTESMELPVRLAHQDNADS